MSKYNQNKINPRKTTNFEDGVAYTMSPELELYTLVSSTMLANVGYKSESTKINDIKRLLTKVNPIFVMKLAIYARTSMNLRTIPIVLLVELAKIVSKKKSPSLSTIFEKTIINVIQRPDEITELLAYYKQSNNLSKLHKLSKPIQRAIGKSFNKFTEYQFGKYNRKKEITLKDALFLSHAKPNTNEQQIIFNKIINNTLEIPYTWETELSKIGQLSNISEEEKNNLIKKTWEDLIDSKKLGYMALLRNLRNIINANVSKFHIKQVCDILSNENNVKKSKQLPIRFFSAYKMICNIDSIYTRSILNALETAVLYSIDNISLFNDCTVLIASDVSGSMFSHFSKKSSVMLYHIGLLFGNLIARKYTYNIQGIFGTDWMPLKPYNDNAPLQGVIDMEKEEGKVGYSTNGYKVIEYLIENNIKIDKIMIFTDCQLWHNTQKVWTIYKKIAPTAKLYLFDLAGHGTVPIDIKTNTDTYLISGWSDKVFDMISAIENGNDVINVINSINL